MWGYEDVRLFGLLGLFLDGYPVPTTVCGNPGKPLFGTIMHNQAEEISLLVTIRARAHA